MFQPFRVVPLLFLPICLHAEVHSLTLAQTMDIASRQNPDVVLSRLDIQRSEEDITIARSPFRPKVYAGSGLAYTYGYPNSIEGNAPSLFQLRTEMELYNRPDSYKVSAARELARGSQFGAQAKAEDIAYQTADMFLNASEMEHQSETLTNQIPSLQRVVGVLSASVAEGTELPLEQKRANVNLASSQQRLDASQKDADYFEMMLAIILGYPATDRVKPIANDPPNINTPDSESDAADIALRNNRELRQMQSNVLAKELDLRSYRAQRLPQFDLVAQYAFFLKQNYENYFQSFQPNNAQIGASIKIPLLVGPQFKGYVAQANTDLAKMRLQMDQARNRIIANTRRSYQQWQKAKSFEDVARMQLDLAREQLTVLLAQNGEGRTPLSQVEQARLEEGNRWIALYDAQTVVTKSKLQILRQMGTLLASMRGNPAPASALP